jgi:hypothetical protein
MLLLSVRWLDAATELGSCGSWLLLFLFLGWCMAFGCLAVLWLALLCTGNASAVDVCRQ